MASIICKQNPSRLMHFSTRLTYTNGGIQFHCVQFYRCPTSLCEDVFGSHFGQMLNAISDDQNEGQVNLSKLDNHR